MATYVHLTSAKLASRVRRSGIRTQARRRGGPGVYAMPVVPGYFMSHQWVRELRKWGRGPMVAVYFRLPDDEPVAIGHYNRSHETMTAAQALATVMQLGRYALGYEVITPHAVAPGAITCIRPVSSRIGWRHYPEAHGRRPCGCPACAGRGEFRARRLRVAYERETCNTPAGDD
jgi:hypothetical protein